MESTLRTVHCPMCPTYLLWLQPWVLSKGCLVRLYTPVGLTQADRFATNTPTTGAPRLYREQPGPGDFCTLIYSVNIY